MRSALILQSYGCTLRIAERVYGVVRVPSFSKHKLAAVAAVAAVAVVAAVAAVAVAATTVAFYFRIRWHSTHHHSSATAVTA